jgi:vacuolar-type H+-ATPase subunit F/Vma7
MSSPTQRTLKHLRDSGYRAEVVERWNPHARIRQDLFTIIDVLALSETEVVAVQTTSASNMKARINKISEADILPLLLKLEWRVIVHGWKKNKQTNRWELKEFEF